MKNWEERFDKKFEGELWLGKYTDVDENGNQYVHRLELKDFIRRLLEEQRIYNSIMGATDFLNSQGVDDNDTFTAGEVQELLQNYIDLLTPATDKLQISK